MIPYVIWVLAPNLIDPQLEFCLIHSSALHHSDLLHKMSVSKEHDV